ncbi:MAG TPA: homoserine kinase, partial [Chondromyces sp.]|nr:homoserine kinase [Chondromyces sp.]
MSAPATMRVPASTANLGPGFDSLGLALNLYLTLHIEEADEWSFEHVSPILEGLPNDKNHLVYQVAKKTADLYHAELPPLKITMESEIPLARGLGSSAAAIAAGIEVADRYARLSLTNEEKLKIGNLFEGHPDNIGASIYGGIVAGVSFGERAELIQLPRVDMDIVVVIPSYELKTEDARNVLPDSFSRKQAVEASAVANVALAALLTGELELAGEMMEKDLFHEPYRISLIKEFPEARQISKENGAFSAVISGAGPTIISFARKGNGERLEKALKASFSSCEVKKLEIDYDGVQYEKVGQK